MTEAMPVTVEQCDRDAAANLFRTSKWFTLEDVAEALARHRLNTRATPPSPAGVERDIEFLRKQGALSDALAARLPKAAREAWYHLTSMYSHRGDGIPTQYTYPEEARNAAVALVLTALTANGSQPDRVVDVLRWLASEQTVAEALAQDGPPEWATMSIDDRLTFMGKRREARDAAILNAREALSTLDAKDQRNG